MVNFVRSNEFLVNLQFQIVSCLRLVVIFLTFLLLITEYEFGGVYTGYFYLKLNMTQDYLSFA